MKRALRIWLAYTIHAETEKEKFSTAAKAFGCRQQRGELPSLGAAGDTRSPPAPQARRHEGAEEVSSCAGSEVGTKIDRVSTWITCYIFGFLLKSFGCGLSYAMLLSSSAATAVDHYPNDDRPLLCIPSWFDGWRRTTSSRLEDWCGYIAKERKQAWTSECTYFIYFTVNRGPYVIGDEKMFLKRSLDDKANTAGQRRPHTWFWLHRRTDAVCTQRWWNRRFSCVPLTVCRLRTHHRVCPHPHKA